MIKPDNISLKDWLITLTSEELELPEDICYNVVNWSYEAANKATKINSSVELSGFGNVFTAPAKIRRRLEAMETRKNHLSEKKDFFNESEALKNTKKIEDIDVYTTYLNTKNKNENSLEGCL